jgi:hypothetical protein
MKRTQWAWREHGALLLAYLGLALWLTCPLALQFDSHYVSSGQNIFFFPATPDAPQNIWNMWWLQYALATAQNPFVSPLLYYPDGVAMYLQTFNIVAGVLALPFNWLLGPTAAYNAAAISGIVLTGYFGYWFVASFTGGRVAPFVAGALLTACPFHIAKFDSGQLNFVTMQWLVLMLLAVVWLTRSPRWWLPLFVALSFLLVLLTDWYWTLVAAFFALVWGLLSLWRHPQPGALLVRLTISGLLCMLVSLPLLIPVVQSRTPQPAPTDGTSIWAFYTQGYSADLFGLFFPAAQHPLWAAPAERFLVTVAPYSITEGSYTAAGWVLLALAIYGLIALRRTPLPALSAAHPLWQPRPHDLQRLLICAALAWLLALGPSLYILGWATGIPLPYALLQHLPILDTARRPNLFGILTIVVAAVFASVALRALLHQRDRRRQISLLAVVGVLALLELWPAQRVAIALERAPVFQSIAERPGVVVDLPLEGGTDSRSLINQIVHQQPILRGYVARPPIYDTLLFAPLVSMLGEMKPWPEEDIVPLDGAALAQMQCFYRLQHVTLDTRQIPPETQAQVAANITRIAGSAQTPSFADATHLGYTLPLSAEPCAPFVYLERGWNNAERNETQLWRWSTDESRLVIVNPATTAQQIIVSLQIEAREADQPLTIWWEDQQIAQFTLTRQQRHYEFVVSLPPGSHTLTLRTPAISDPSAQRVIGVSVQHLRVR